MSSNRLPKTWREYSLEYKCLFAYFGVMAAMFITGVVPVPFELVIAGGLVLAFVFVSIGHHRRLAVPWPHPSPGEWLKATVSVGLIGLFLFAASRGVPLYDSNLVPWLLGGAGIGLFSFLQQLKVVAPSEAEFVSFRTGGFAEQGSTLPGEAHWKRYVRIGFSLFALSIWLCGIMFFYFDGTVRQQGSPVPTLSRTVPEAEHGVTVFVTRNEGVLLGDLRLAMMLGIPAVFAVGLFLHFVLGIRMTDDATEVSQNGHRSD